MTLVCQDSGGLIGLTIPMDMPSRFSRLIVMNTALGTGDAPLREGFLAWRAFSNKSPDMDIAGLMKRGVDRIDRAPRLKPMRRPILTPATRQVCGAFRISCRPVRRSAAQPVAARGRRCWSTEWAGKSFMAIAVKDPVLAPAS